jgi:hypothetical protein
VGGSPRNLSIFDKFFVKCADVALVEQGPVESVDNVENGHQKGTQNVQSADSYLEERVRGRHFAVDLPSRQNNGTDHCGRCVEFLQM